MWNKKDYSNRKLPYIPDKDLYAAVMGACSWIRESGYFNKATKYYADKYGVDVDDVRSYVRIAQGNGQRQAHIKYRWFIFSRIQYDYHRTESYGYSPSIHKGASFEKVRTRLWNEDYDAQDRYRCDFLHIPLGNRDGYSTRKEAEEAMYAMTNEEIKAAEESYCEEVGKHYMLQSFSKWQEESAKEAGKTTGGLGVT